ncbi:MAG: hypothetical protein QOJ25_3407, partial [Solirubrobacteraceae bacterium]|nr:hypothetical protein [Solirubrobacteraceae bacterium]
MSASELLGRPIAVANVGVGLLADELERQGVAVERVAWRPPARGSEESLARLALDAAANGAANEVAVARIQEARPVLVG